MKLFLDDYRSPTDCLSYMHKELGPKNLIYKEGFWSIVRSYDEFIFYFEKYEFPELISFDHDLADAHYVDEENIKYHELKEKTGYHCAQWLVDYCLNYQRNLPDFIVHSMNPVGKNNIEMLLNNFKRFQEENQ